MRRCGWLLLAYHAVCLPLAACGVIGPAAAAVLACGASGGALQSFLPRGWMKYIVKGSAVLVVTLGLSMLVKGIRLFGM